MMRKLLLLLFLLPSLAHASWFSFEAGLGGAISHDLGDGTWYQDNVSIHHEQLSTPTYLVGVRLDPVDHLTIHFDYTYWGQFSASCVCVSDAAYFPSKHPTVPGTVPFNGFGHVQSLSLTFEPYLRWHSLKWGVEAGPMLYWNTWHDTAIPPGSPPLNLNHVTQTQLGWLAGFGVEGKHFGIHYRYMFMRQQWNPTPSLARDSQMILFTWRW